MHALRFWVASLLLAVSSCRCGGGLTTIEPPSLRVADRLTVPDAFLGYSTSSSLEVTNVGAPVTVTLELQPPFSVDRSTLMLGTGVTERVQITFTPTAAGPARGTLALGTLAQVEVTSTGLQPPVCMAMDTCRRSALDVALGQCVETFLPVGAECSTRCITMGACDARQQCVGQARQCDDGDACTVDACDESAGCVSSPRTCQAPANPCQEAFCDPASGCGVRDLQDGTVCGRDDCLATHTDVCIAGSCVSRPRPALARCTNRWVPQLPHPNSFIAFDHRRARLVTIDWSNRETWELQGSTWFHRTPLARPASVYGPMFWNPRRQRVQLFSETTLWEWDGLTWLSSAVPAPPVALGLPWEGAWDEARGVLVVSGRATVAQPSTCEWDGVRWSACSPTGHTVRAMTWDPSGNRVIAIGSSPGAGPGTFGWRGSWQRLASGPGDCSLSPDPLRTRVVASCAHVGLADAGTGGTWEWDGGVWSRVSAMPASRVAAQTWDPGSQRTLAFTGEVSAWDGTQWTVVAASSVPTAPSGASTLGWDPVSGRLLLFDRGLVTWARTDGGWSQLTPFGGSLPHALATDTARSRLVLVRTSGLMEWDGQQWVDAGVRGPPLRSGFKAVFDESRRQLVLLGNQSDAGLDSRSTWLLDGGWVLAAVDTQDPMLQTAAFEPSSGTIVATFASLDAGVASVSSWSWNGSVWSRRFASPLLLEATWDPTRQRLLAYDPYTPATLEWTGAGWVTSTIAGTPEGTAQLPSMAFDSSARQMTLWNGAIWVLLP